MYRVCFCERGCSFFFCLDTKEKEPKKKRSRAGACGATASPLFADGAITRFAQTVAPSLRLPAIPLTPLRQGSFYATSLRSFFFVFLLRSVYSVQMGCTVASLCWFALFSLLKKYAVTLLICFALLLCFFLIQHSFTVVLSVDSLVCLLKKICICFMGLLCCFAPLYCTTVSYSSLLILFSVTASYAFVLSNSFICFYSQ